MPINSVKELLIFMSESVREIADGLMSGISSFSGAVRVAAIAIAGSDDTFFICDDYELLTPHWREIEAYFGSDKTWSKRLPKFDSNSYPFHIQGVGFPKLQETVAWATSSPMIRYQVWFVEKHPDLVNEGPIREWLEECNRLLVFESFAWDLGPNRPYKVLSTAVENYTIRAVSNFIICQLYSATGANTKLNVAQAIDAILGISTTFEEGQRASGRILIAESEVLQQQTFVARFPSKSLPRLENWKQAQKLLRTLSGSDHSLVSDGHYLFGIGDKTDSIKGTVNVNFHGGRGEICVNSEPVCSFRDGRLYSYGIWPKLDELNNLLTKFTPDDQAADLSSIVQTLAETAVRSRHGCTIVIELKEQLEIGGQLLEPPINLHTEELLSLAAAMSEVDGALKIGTNGALYAFGCILDGRRSTKEDLSRGSRYNSALRFSESQPDCLVVVVSEDGHTSIFHEGKDRQQHPKRLHSATRRPMILQTLDQWLRERES
ncbi:MAG: DNA integrity scanning protein DisA nucleotide-binding domain protein [Desulfomonilaceae bacterium]